MTRLKTRCTIATVLAAIASCLPNPNPVCLTGQTNCGNTNCVDTQNDIANCGGCALPCPLGYDCRGGTCVCPASTIACGGEDGGGAACVSTQNDPHNCGGCGHVCSTDGGAPQVCAQGQCVTACPPGTPTVCGGGCVDTTGDRLNCGQCGHGCGQGEACVSSVCRSDLVAACFNTQQLLSLESGSLSQQAASITVNGPQSLAFYAMPDGGGDRLAVVDTLDSALYHVSADGTPQLLSGFDALGASPNQVIALDNACTTNPHTLWVVNSLDNNVQAIDYTQPIPASGTARTVAQVPTTPSGAASAAHTNPYLMTAAVNPASTPANRTMLYVTLYGDCTAGATGMAAGNKVLEIDPCAGTVTRTYAVASGPALLPPDGGATYAQPSGIATANGTLYVTLPNATADCFTAHGPGFVEVIDIASFTQRALLQLPANCLNPGYILASGNTLYLTCTGTYDPTTFLPAGNGGLATIDAATDHVTGFVPLACPTASDGGCEQPAPGRMRLRNGKLFIGDTGDGRLFVVGTDGTVIQGPTNPVNLCLKGANPYQEIGDVATP